MSNWGASTMSPIGLETKHFPTFQQADPLQWETAFPSNNSLLFLTSPATTATMPPPPYMATPPFDLDPLISHQLQPAAATQLHFLTESTSLLVPESVTPITDLCTFVKLESGINEDDYGICKYGFSGQNFACRSDDFALNLGYRTYFPSCEPTAAMKKLCNWSRAGALIQVPRRCQAEGCNVDLSNGKHYNRRHKVCEFHSKAPKVVIQGVVKRFCQQCSRFHVLEEFDGVKRSCRKRLADHNRRRRKSRPPSASESNNSNAADIGGNCESKSDLTDALNHSPPETCSEEDASRVLIAEAAQEAKEASATVKARSPPLMAINNVNPVNNKEEEEQALHPHHDQHLSVELLKATQQQGPSPTFLFIN